MENLNIRKATIEDIVELKKLEAKCFDERIRENFNFVLENKNYLYLVAFFNKNIVAYAGASISYEQGELLSICVDSSYRKQGLATKILKELFFILKHTGVLKIFLEVNKKNTPALNLYKKIGFEFLSERKNYYGKDSAIVMVKEL